MKIGIDLGGTKIEILALGEKSETLYQDRQPTPQGDYVATIQGIAEMVFTAEKKCGEKGSVGIGIPGCISQQTGLVKNANSVCLIGQPLDKDLSALLQRPIRVENDANCFALSEAIDGAGESMDLVFGVILGTGTGGGLVAHQRLLQGPNGITGEWGHNPLPWMNEDEQIDTHCYCGQSGCIETFLSGPGLSRDHQWVSGKDLSAEQIVASAISGDFQAQASMARYVERLSKSLASIVNIYDPHVIVLGGGLSNIDWLYEEIPKRWGKYVFSDQVLTKLRKNHHGDASGVRGAAWLYNEG